MNYFHIQLHPNNAIGVENVKRILEKAIIGVGSGNSDAAAFKSQPNIGDVVEVYVHGEKVKAKIIEIQEIRERYMKYPLIAYKRI